MNLKTALLETCSQCGEITEDAWHDGQVCDYCWRHCECGVDLEEYGRSYGDGFCAWCD